MASMLRDYYYPLLADRTAPIVWEEQGKRDIWQIARSAARETLSSHYPQYLTSSTDIAIRERFNILLDPALLRAS